MVEIVRVAEQLSTSVLYERGVEASLQLRELAFRIPRDREEFSMLLGQDADKLSDIELRCELWADVLSEQMFPVGMADKKRLIGETLNAVQELSAIQGRLRRAIDQEEA